MKKTKSTASVKTDATIFFAQIRRDAVCRLEILGSAHGASSNHSL